MKITLLFALLIVTGCSSAPLLPSGGSKADGIVEFSQNYAPIRKPKVTPEVKIQALQMCKKWGYENADFLPHPARECSRYYNFSCNQYRYTFKFQCI